jgi:fimbrial chaperone protein
VFFPPLLSLAPKAERKIRVGKITPCGASEKTYRLFIEELPPLRSPGRPDTGTHVRTLTRFGIPVFLEPTKPAAKRNVELTDIRPGHFSVAVRNPGNVHLHLHRVRIKGLGAAGVSVFERELASSYVLAGGTRLYEVDVPPAECPRVERLEVDVTTDGDTFAERFEAPAGVCGR